MTTGRNDGLRPTTRDAQAEAIRGMQVKSWEVREHSDGKRVVYVRFAPKEPAITMNVNHEIR